ncbi:MAG: ABC transporter substrate-binding protein [Bacteroidota bacterium]
MPSKFLSTNLYALIAIALLQCQPYKSEDASAKKFQTQISDEPVDFSQEIDVKYAQNFSVENFATHKVAHIHFKSEQRDIKFDQKIVFYPRGQAIPELPEELKDAWMIKIPLQTVAANDDGEITRLSSLGLKDHIIAMGGGGIYDLDLRKRWEEKEIASIGYSFHQVPLAELILALNPDLLMLYSYDHDRLEALQKLRDLGVNAIPQFAWAEPSILGKAEWIKFTALFFNKEKEAEEQFNRLVNRCMELRSMAAQKSPKKKVFMTYFPSAESDWSVHRNDFYTSFLEFAGGINVLKDDGPSHQVGMNNEKLLDLASEADIWIGNSTSDEEWPPETYLNSFKAYRNGQVYHYQKRTRHEHNAYDWYETPEVRPDLVIEDLVFIFYPELLPDHELKFFDRVKLKKES